MRLWTRAIVAVSCGESPQMRCAYCSSLSASRLSPTAMRSATRDTVGNDVAAAGALRANGAVMACTRPALMCCRDRRP